MKKRDAILAAVAIISVVIYGLACRPAWHPSGKSVAFPFLDENAQGIALYDVETGIVKRVYEESAEDGGFIQCLWTSDGKALLSAEPGKDKTIRILKIDPGTGRADTIATISGLAQGVAPSPLILVNDRYLWIGYLQKEGTGENFQARVDLASGQVEDFFVSKEKTTALHDLGKRGYAYLQVNEQSEPSKRVCEVGTFDPVSGALNQLFTLADVVPVGGAMAAEPEGSRFALCTNAGGASSDTPAPALLLIVDQAGKTEKSVPLPKEAGAAPLDMVWVGADIWMGTQAEFKIGETTHKQEGLLRVAVESGKAYFTPLGWSSGDESLEALQPSVSPDGKKLAASGTFLRENGKPGPAILAIVDLAAPDEWPTIVEVPPGTPAAITVSTESAMEAPAEKAK